MISIISRNSTTLGRNYFLYLKPLFYSIAELPALLCDLSSICFFAFLFLIIFTINGLQEVPEVDLGPCLNATLYCTVLYCTDVRSFSCTDHRVRSSILYWRWHGDLPRTYLWLKSTFGLIIKTMYEPCWTTSLGSSRSRLHYTLRCSESSGAFLYTSSQGALSKYFNWRFLKLHLGTAKWSVKLCEPVWSREFKILSQILHAVKSSIFIIHLTQVESSFNSLR